MSCGQEVAKEVGLAVKFRRKAEKRVGREVRVEKWKRSFLAASKNRLDILLLRCLVGICSIILFTSFLAASLGLPAYSLPEACMPSLKTQPMSTLQRASFVTPEATGQCAAVG